MAYYQKKPVVVEAIQWSGDNFGEVAILGQGGERIFHLSDDNRLSIRTLEGEMFAEIGDYIIKGVRGECYPCKVDIFAATYESVERQQDNKGVGGGWKTF